jgi:hypothetical protein
VPLENVFLRGRDCQEAAQHINPITELSKIIAIYTIIKNTGLFAMAIHAWDQIAAPLQTCTFMQTRFLAAKVSRQRNLTAAQAGFHAANNVANVGVQDPTAANNPAPPSPVLATASPTDSPATLTTPELD